MSMNPNPGRPIIVQTYDGWDVLNAIDADPTPGLVQLAKRGDPHVRYLKPLGPPTGRYNCHGLVFASRRTNIPPAQAPDAVQIDEILRRDQYERIQASPQVGDVVVYRYQNGEIEHTALISRIEQIGAESVVFVWGKWGALEEYEHHEKVCTYADDCRIEYWRLKQ